jgi:hypothetical protein
MATLGGGSVSSADLAGILRAAADQVAAGGTVAHPTVATAVNNAGQWSSTGQPISQADLANLLRSIADRAAAGTLVNDGTAGTTAGSMSSADLATLLRNASDAAASAAQAAAAPDQGGSPGSGQGSARG